MRVDKTKWKQNIISDCIKTIKVKDAIQKKDYQQYGKYPIISQEKDFISGYCDSIENLNSIGEVVIFGDHTRVLKFVDFDFCVGADGVKVILPNSDINTKYLFYFFKWADIPSNGYSRHFKFLKELNISYPSLPNQQVIASELDAIQKMIDGYKAQLEDLDALAQSIFLDMFGDPVANPKGWEVKKLYELVKESCALTYGIVQPGDEYPNGVPAVRSIDMSSSIIRLSELKRVAPSIAEKFKRTTLVGDEIFISCRGVTGMVSLASSELKGGNITRGLVSVRLEIGERHFIYYCLKMPQLNDLIQSQTKGATLRQINVKDIRLLPIIFPPLPLQQQFATRVEQIEKQKEQIRLQLTDAETLMAERMQYYFS